MAIESANVGSITYGAPIAVTTANSGADANGPFDAVEATTAAGTAKVTDVNGVTGTLYLPLGVIKPVALGLVWTTGTTATGIVGYRGIRGRSS